MLPAGTSGGTRSLVKGPSARLKGIRDFKIQPRDCTENVVVVQKRVKKCTNERDARAELLFWL